MKMPFLFFILFIFTGQGIFGQDFIIGNFDREAFLQTPYIEWFEEEWNNYEIDEKALNDINLYDGHLEIKILLGTWCGDSRREVPRFLKMIDHLDFEDSNIQLMGLDREKKAPDYEANIWNIEYVPTFVFLYDGYEIGRIIESPEISLEEDTRNILGYDKENYPMGGELNRFHIVEQMARFPGCEDIDGDNLKKEECAKKKMMEYLSENLNYPEKARFNKTEGKVISQFVVDENGFIINIQIINGIGDGCDGEVVRLLNSMNRMPQRWISAKKRGEDEAILYTLPINFRLE